ncbi:DsbC family protein [Sphingobium sp. BHU LFT2]|uniref:DsbC family protein n=1 Tax=Sphingobium sp. BHU LFT2 TaxID=2807634 RepID=UPI001BE9917B|nr:DsbC family protein [Sphingobium sp. BHU LFT2]MBT2246639.1 DsbC family protein [Sphingobium sp. BHU LFT2]
MTRHLKRSSVIAAALMLGSAAPASSQTPVEPDLSELVRSAEAQLHQSFANLQFEDFAPSPVHGPLFQASAGGRILYYAPESDHLLFATIYDKNGVNLTALSQDAAARARLKDLDQSQALLIGPQGAPLVIEFTDPDCPYCRALDRFWAAKAAEGRPVRRQIYFVSGIHPEAASKAEHILCAKDREAAFRATYAGEPPKPLNRCADGAAQVQAHAQAVKSMGISGTPTLILDGQVISGFSQAEIEAWLARQRPPAQPPP